MSIEQRELDANITVEELRAPLIAGLSSVVHDMASRFNYRTGRSDDPGLAVKFNNACRLLRMYETLYGPIKPKTYDDYPSAFGGL